MPEEDEFDPPFMAIHALHFFRSVSKVEFAAHSAGVLPEASASSITLSVLTLSYEISDHSKSAHKLFGVLAYCRYRSILLV